MTEENINNHSNAPDKTAFLSFSQIREQAEQKAKAIPLPDLDSMGTEEIIQLFHEFHAKRLEADLQAEQFRKGLEKTNSILNGIRDGIWSLKWPDFEIVYLSPAIEEIYGRTLLDFFEQPDLWHKVTHPEDHPLTWKASEQLRERGVATRECRIIKPDGSIAWIADKCKLVFDKNNNPLRVDGVCRDITESKQSEERIRHLNAVLKALVSVNEILSNAREKKGMLKDICQTLTSTRGYHNAWIILLDSDRVVTDWAEDGIGEKFQDLLCQLRQGKMPSCVLKALASPLPQIVSDPSVECIDCPLAAGYSGRAGFVIRLGIEDEAAGLLAVSAPKDFLYDVMEHELFMNLARAITQGIKRLHLEAVWQRQKQHLNNYERIISRINDPMSLIDNDYRYIAVNDAYLREFDKSREEIEGHTVADLLGLEIFLNAVKPHLDKALAGREVVYEDCHSGLDGSLKFWIMNYYPCDADDTLKAVVVRSLDITNRKRREQQHELRSRLISYSAEYASAELMTIALDEIEQLLNSSISFLHFVDQDQKTLYLQQWSTATKERFCNATGKGLHYNIDQAGVWVDCVREREGLIHNDYASLPNKKGLPEGHAEVIREMVVPVMRKGVIAAIMGVGNKPVPYTQEDLTALSFLADVTYEVILRKIAEEELRSNEEKYRRLFETMSQGVIYQDADGKIISANPAAEKILGLPFDQIRGKTSMDPRWKMIKEDGSKVSGTEHPVMIALRTGQKVGPVIRGVFHPGKNTHIWLSITAIPLFQPGNTKPFQTYATFADITARKQAMAERKKLQDQLAHARKMESIGALAGGVAHEFNNKLCIMSLCAEMAMEEIGPESPAFSKVKEIMKTGRQTADLVNQLMGFARKQVIKPIEINLNGTISGMLNIYQKLMKEDIELIWKPGNNLWRVKMDPSQVNQIITNVCTNARDAITGEGRVTISTDNVTIDTFSDELPPESRSGDYVMLTISDDGCGMDLDIREKMFDPFFTTKEVGKGTGLGLPSVYGIVKQNNGFIIVDSEPGQGSSFRHYIPRYAGDAKPLSEDVFSSVDMLGHETILVVEDDENLLALCRTMLEKHGCRVIGASTPGEAIRRGKDHDGDIHLLLTDVVMPEMNGQDLAKSINSIYPAIKCIFMSGHTDEVVAQKGIIKEHIHFIQKPFSMKDLIEKIQKLLSVV